MKKYLFSNLEENNEKHSKTFPVIKSVKNLVDSVASKFPLSTLSL